MIDYTSQPTEHSAPSPEPDPDFITWFKDNSVPVASVIFGALLFCLIGHYSSVTVDWTRTKDFTQAFVNVTQSLALIAGGVWAYFKFAKGRTFRDRLIPAVTGKFVSIEGVVFMVITMQLQNVGLSRIAFDQEVSSLVVFEYFPSGAEKRMTVQSKRLTACRILGAKDKYIEPNELIKRQILIALPPVSIIGYQLEVEVVADSGYAWRAMTIVDRSGFEQ